MTKILRTVAATAVVAAGLGLAGLTAATDAHAQPGPLSTWCPGDFWDPGWGNNWDFGRCHDDHWFDGEPRDQAHWHGW
jgi:spermidine/putrescine-binding protein